MCINSLTNSKGEIKLITVGHKTIGNVVYPRILFTGDWLIELGFLPETIVSAIYENNVLKLSAHGIGMEVYQNIVRDVRKKHGQIFQALKTMPSVNKHTNRNLDLAIDGEWLRGQGFNIGDILIVRLSPKLIEIKRFDPYSVGFDQCDELRLIQVGKSRVFPRIVIKASWLNNYGFSPGSVAKITYSNDMMCFSSCEAPPPIPRGTKQRSHITIGTAKRKRKRIPDRLIPTFSLTGIWLEDMGYRIGDYLLLGIRQNHISLKHLNSQSLFEQ